MFAIQYNQSTGYFDRAGNLVAAQYPNGLIAVGPIVDRVLTGTGTPADIARWADVKIEAAGPRQAPREMFDVFVHTYQARGMSKYRQWECVVGRNTVVVTATTGKAAELVGLCVDGVQYRVEGGNLLQGGNFPDLENRSRRVPTALYATVRRHVLNIRSAAKRGEPVNLMTGLAAAAEKCGATVYAHRDGGYGLDMDSEGVPVKVRFIYDEGAICPASSPLSAEQHAALDKFRVAFSA